MTEPGAYERLVLGDAVREHHNPRPLRQKDQDRTEVGRVLRDAGVRDADIALVCGIQPRQVPAVLRGERV